MHRFLGFSLALTGLVMVIFGPIAFFILDESITFLTAWVPGGIFTIWITHPAWLPPTKGYLAKWLVRRASRWLDASYGAYCLVDKSKIGPWWHTLWSKGARLVNRVAIPLAKKLDSEAMADQMVEEGWWG